MFYFFMRSVGWGGGSACYTNVLQKNKNLAREILKADQEGAAPVAMDSEGESSEDESL